MSKPQVHSSISIDGLKKKTKIDFPSAPDGRLIIQEDKVEIPSTSRDDFDSGTSFFEFTVLSYYNKDILIFINIRPIVFIL